jgi:putative hydrolase of HD superfamily
LVDPMIMMYFHINHLKQIYRQGWLRKGRDIPEKQCESVADHIFGMSILGLFLCELRFPDLDRLKVLMMCLIHELGEIINGDPKSPKGHAGKRKKHLAERAAIKIVMTDFPNADKYLDLWEEFEIGNSPEAKLVRQLDKLEMAFQAKIYSLQHGNNLQEFLDDVRNHLESEELKILLNQIERL